MVQRYIQYRLIWHSMFTINFYLLKMNIQKILQKAVDDVQMYRKSI